MRVAFFGGSFDPPHCGHQAVAMTAVGRLGLDQVLVAPVGSQPLKGGLATTSYAERLAMVQLMCGADARLMASEVDAPKADGRHNYTYDTLAGLREHLPAGTKLFCLLGADSFHTLPHWHRAAELLLLCDLIVAARPGYALQDLQERLPAGVVMMDRLERPGVAEVRLAEVTGEGSSTIHLLLDLEEHVSATALRQALAAGDVAASGAMLPTAVARYIQERGLYREAESAD